MPKTTAILLLLSAVALSQSDVPYRTLVRAYRKNADSSRAQALALSTTELAAGVHDAVRSGSSWTAEERESAVAMNTDVAAQLMERDQTLASAWLNASVDLADTLAGRDQRVWFVVRWYEGVGEALRHATFGRWLDARRRQQPWFHAADSLEHGLQLEAEGNERPQFSGGLPITDTAVYRPRAFAQALAYLNVTFPPIRPIGALHLGRIEMLTGDDSDARRHFEEARTDQQSSVRYDAELFLADLDERHGDVQAAIKAYGSALMLFPGAQSAHLAFAALLARRGDWSQARAIASVEPATDPARRFDPWWAYFPRDVAATLPSIAIELRAEVQQ